TYLRRGTPGEVRMPVGVRFTAASAGAYMSVALAAHGTAWAWGANGDGELGDGTTTTETTPVRVSMPAGVRFASVSAGFAHSLALAADGTVWAWGSNNHGQLGDGT